MKYRLCSPYYGTKTTANTTKELETMMDQVHEVEQRLGGWLIRTKDHIVAKWYATRGWVYIPAEYHMPAWVAILKAVADGENYLGATAERYRLSGYGGWGTMAANTAINRMCGIITANSSKGIKAHTDTSKALLTRTKGRHPNGNMTWRYSLTELGRAKLDKWTTEHPTN